MMRHAAIALFLFLPFSYYSQIVEKYKTFQIKNVSLKTARAVTFQLAQPPTHAEYTTAVQNFYTSVKHPELIVSEFKNTIEEIQKANHQRELEFKIKREAVKLGFNVAAEYKSTLSHLGKIIKPGILQIADLWSENMHGRLLKENQKAVDEAIKLRFSILKAQGSVITPTTSAAVFNQVFALAATDFPDLSAENLRLFNKEITHFAYKYIKENRQSIDRLSEQLEKISVTQVKDRQELQNQIDRLKKVVEGETISVGEITSVKNNLAESVAAITTTITAQREDYFQNVAVAMDRLLRNQKTVFTSLNHIEKQTNQNSISIKKLEREIVGIREDLELVKSDAAATRVKIREMDSVQALHAELLAGHSVQLGVLSGYVLQTLIPINS